MITDPEYKQESARSVLPSGPFDIIVADPAWSFRAWSGKGLQRAPERHYQTMSLDAICALPVASVADRDCLLMLWINGPSLAQGWHNRVIEAWGFKSSSVGFVWIKPKNKRVSQLFPLSSSDFAMGLGHTTRQNAEYVIFARKGSPKRHSKSIHQLIVAPRREHSRKPEEFYRLAEAYSGPDARRLEMFSREPRAGWTAWGNETDKFSKNQ